MDDFELRERPDFFLEAPANDLDFCIGSIPKTTREYLYEHGMLHLSFDVLETRWKWRKDVFPDIREHSDFFENLPAMRSATEFYGEHVETYNGALTPYTRFFSPDFLGFLDYRGLGELSFQDIAHRFQYFSPFDAEVTRWKDSFEMIHRISIFQVIESSPLNISMADIVHHEAWSFSPNMRKELCTILERRGWEKLFDTFVIFGNYPHLSSLQDVHDLLPYDVFFERVFHCAREFLTPAILGRQKIPEGNWFGPRISMAENRYRRNKKPEFLMTNTSVMMSLSAVVLLSVLVALGTEDYSRGKYHSLREYIPVKIEALIRYFQEQIGKILGE